MDHNVTYVFQPPFLCLNCGHEFNSVPCPRCKKIHLRSIPQRNAIDNAVDDTLKKLKTRIESSQPYAVLGRSMLRRSTILRYIEEARRKNEIKTRMLRKADEDSGSMDDPD